MTDETTHTFDWHAEPSASFFHHAVLWMVTNERSTRAQNDQLFDKLSELTDKWSSVELGITLNGVEMDAKAFIERLDKAFDWAVAEDAKRIVIESIPGLDKLIDTVSDLERQVQQTAIKLAADAGYDISDRERW